MRIGVLTGGGDAPGLNAFLRFLVRGALPADEVIGFEDAFLGLVEDRCLRLDRSNTRGLYRLGGTILGSTNRANPFSLEGQDRTADAARTCRRHRLDVLVAVGGDGTLGIAGRFAERHGIAVLGVPKTIDGDVAHTDATLGFATAVAVATEALDRLEATASSHHRTLVLEVMGRTSGRLALHTAIAGGADGVLLSEFPFDHERVRALVERRKAIARFSTIVAAEGARPLGGEERHRLPHSAGAATPLGGIGEEVAGWVERTTGVESRAVVLGHVVRGAIPIPEDRILAARLAGATWQAARTGRRGAFLGTRGEEVVALPLANVTGVTRILTAGDPAVATARGIGVDLCAASAEGQKSASGVQELLGGAPV